MATYELNEDEAYWISVAIENGLDSANALAKAGADEIDDLLY